MLGEAQKLTDAITNSNEHVQQLRERVTERHEDMEKLQGEADRARQVAQELAEAGQRHTDVLAARDNLTHQLRGRIAELETPPPPLPPPPSPPPSSKATQTIARVYRWTRPSYAEPASSPPSKKENAKQGEASPSRRAPPPKPLPSITEFQTWRSKKVIEFLEPYIAGFEKNARDIFVGNQYSGGTLADVTLQDLAADGLPRGPSREI